MSDQSELTHRAEAAAIAESLRRMAESPCAKRQAIQATKAHIETLVDLDVALLTLGEVEPRKYGAFGE